MTFEPGSTVKPFRSSEGIERFVPLTIKAVDGGYATFEETEIVLPVEDLHAPEQADILQKAERDIITTLLILFGAKPFFAVQVEPIIGSGMITYLVEEGIFQAQVATIGKTRLGVLQLSESAYKAAVDIVQSHSMSPMVLVHNNNGAPAWSVIEAGNEAFSDVAKATEESNV